MKVHSFSYWWRGKQSKNFFSWTPVESRTGYFWDPWRWVLKQSSVFSKLPIQVPNLQQHFTQGCCQYHMCLRLIGRLNILISALLPTTGIRLFESSIILYALYYFYSFVNKIISPSGSLRFIASWSPSHTQSSTNYIVISRSTHKLCSLVDTVFVVARDHKS